MRIAVAMSGGVDSSVAALLLQRQGAEVIGLSMQLFDHSRGHSRCCSGEDLCDAQRVAARLAIPHYVLDFEAIFERAVRQPFVASYLAGETPIPCVECNTAVKFAPLLERARALGCEQIATGHYARVVDTAAGRRLARARDRAKDQSYFLFELDSEVLGRTHFPLGELTKTEVRELARDAALPVADKDDSQEICFVPPTSSYDVVVDADAPGDRSGRFVDAEGRAIGHHDGYHRFTVGQRRGFGVGFGDRRYVLAVHPDTHDVVLGDRRDLLVSAVELRDFRWSADAALTRGEVQLRSRMAPEPVTIEREERRAILRFDRPIPTSAPGQAAVIYVDDLVAGGGRIVGAISSDADAASGARTRPCDAGAARSAESR